MSMDSPHPDNSIIPQSVHATPALVLGILSIVLSGCFVAGLVLGFIGLAKVRAGFRDLQSRPGLGGQGMLQAGRVCGIVGIVLGLLQAILWIVYLGFVALLILLKAADRTS